MPAKVWGSLCCKISSQGASQNAAQATLGANSACRRHLINAWLVLNLAPAWSQPQPGFCSGPSQQTWSPGGPEPVISQHHPMELAACLALLWEAQAGRQRESTERACAAQRESAGLRSCPVRHGPDTSSSGGSLVLQPWPSSSSCLSPGVTTWTIGLPSSRSKGGILRIKCDNEQKALTSFLV